MLRIVDNLRKAIYTTSHPFSLVVALREKHWHDVVFASGLIPVCCTIQIQKGIAPIGRGLRRHTHLLKNWRTLFNWRNEFG